MWASLDGRIITLQASSVSSLMSSTKQKTAKNRRVQRTGYPHIVKIKGVCGGDAVIEGTRIAVWHIVGYHYQAGMSVEELLRDFPHLKPAQILAALAYYHDNKAEIDQARYENSYEYWQQHYGQPDPAAAEDVS